MTYLLDVAIGLAFIYTILSLLTSALVEVFEMVLRTRGKYLWRGIGELVQDRPQLGLLQDLKPAVDQRAPEPVNAGGAGAKADGSRPIRLSEVYGHPLIGSLYPADYEEATGRMLSRKLPSYIPRGNFAAVLIDLVSQRSGSENVSTIERFRRGVHALNDQPPGPALRALLAISGDDLSALQRSLEGWYDSAMDRVSGWYKRHAQVMLILLGFVVALVLNADTIAVTRHLVVDEPAREALVEAAGEFVAAHERTPQDSTMEDVQAYLAQIEGRGGPIGTSVPWDNPLTYVGCLLTAFAISLGASFWFDLLNRIMVIRSTVKPKEKSGDEAPEERQAGSSSRAGIGPASYIMRR